MNNRKKLILETNLVNKNDLVDDINKVLDNKNISQFSGMDKNVIRTWFHTHYLRAILNDEIDLKTSLKKHNYSGDEPEWMKKSDLVDYTGSLPEDVVDEIGHIIDYFNTLDANDLRKINKETYQVIKNKVEEWDEQLASGMDDKKEDVEKKKLIPNKDYKEVMKIGSFKIVKLITPSSKTIEGDVMGHCVGGEHYDKLDIYSLWDNKNRSHVTFELNDRKKTIDQIKGKQNGPPVEKYQPATIEFVAARMLNGYKVKHDGENIEMVKHGDEYYFDNLEVLPEKYRTNELFRIWTDKIFPTEIYPKQQKAISDILKRIIVTTDS